MNVLSLFDGMSCARLALKKMGITVNNYYASEIDRYAIKVAKTNFPNTIHLGNIEKHNSWKLPKIKLLTAGSPCQDLSKIKGSKGKGLKGEKSKLFFQFADSLERVNPDYFLFENVVMNKESEDIITEILGVKPITISSKHFSAQDRPRMYWTNIPVEGKLPHNSTVIKDIIEHEVPEKYFYDDEIIGFYPNKRVVGNLHRYYENGKVKFTETTARVYNVNFKAPTLTAVSGGHQEKKIYINDRVRKLTPIEYERLQNVPDGYTSCVSDSQRYKMLGNGWTVDVIAYLLNGVIENKQPIPRNKFIYKAEQLALKL